MGGLTLTDRTKTRYSNNKERLHSSTTKVSVREVSATRGRSPDLNDRQTPLRTSSQVRYRSSSPESDEECCCCDGRPDDEEEEGTMGEELEVDEEDEAAYRLASRRRRSTLDWVVDDLASDYNLERASPGQPSNLSPASSPLPSLSPSRPRLFEDDTDDEDDEDVIATPSSGSSSLSRTPSITRRPLRSAATCDPLLSPAPSTPILVFGAGWSPPSPKAPVSQSSPPSLAGIPLSPPKRPSVSLTSAPPISLLTRSLRSLARLPNLALPDLALPSIRPPLTGLDLEGLGPVDESPWEWRSGRSSVGGRDDGWFASSSSPVERSEPARRLSTGADNREATPRAVQLKTFSTSPPPSPSPQTVPVDLPPPIATPTTSAPPPSPEPASSADTFPSPPAISHRFISNSQHLLCISLELEMMRADKIRSPLRPRAVVVRLGSPSGGQSGAGMSPLRWEVTA